MKILPTLLCLLFTFSSFAQETQKKDILDSYFVEEPEMLATKEMTEEEKKEKNSYWDTSQFFKKKQKVKGIFSYSVSMAIEKHYYANQIFIAHQNTNDPLSLFVGGEAYHKQNEREFSGLAFAFGLNYEIHENKYFYLKSGFKQSIESWNVPANRKVATLASRTSLMILKVSLKVSPNFFIFSHMDYNFIWGENERLSGINDGAKADIRKQLNYAYGILLKI